MPETTFWGIHATGSKLESILLMQNQLAIGWHELGDVSSAAHDREAIKARLAVAMPNEKPGAIPVYAGQIHRFVSELAIDVRPDDSSRQVVGPYVHDPAGEPAHPNRRSVQWLKAVPITPVSQGALYELCSAMTFFQLKNYADEWAELLSGELPATPPETDESVADASEATEQNTRDFVRKRLSKELKGHPFAQFVGQLLQIMGYRTRVAPEGVDGGIDIIAHRDELGFERRSSRSRSRVATEVWVARLCRN